MRPHVQSGARFRVMRRLGIGGMAEVFLADDGRQQVALKRLIGEDVDRLDLFLDEARLAARFQHPNIVRVHELGCDEEGLYISLEYVDGRPLSAVLARARRGPPLTCRLGAHIAGEVARALDYVHRATGDGGEPLGVVHRDVSPANVLVSMAGEVKLTDFGIAKALGAVHRTRTGVVRGTACYMSPEQAARRPIDARSDVWSAGVILWEATLGRRLFDGDDAAAVQAQIAAGLVPAPSSVAPSYPRDLDAVVMAALEPDPARRCDAAALLAGIDAYLARIGGPPVREELAADMASWFGDGRTDEPAPATASTAASRASGSWWTRRRWLLWIAVLAGVAAAAVAAAGVWRGGGEPRAAPAPDRPPARAELDAVWRIAQRGGHEQARQIVDELLDTHPRDPEVAILGVLVHWWLGTQRIEPLIDQADGLRLMPEGRALMRGLSFLHLGRNAEAVMSLQAAEARHPGSAEIAYALGEARWHSGDRAGGVAMLLTALRRDPRWQMALHHVIDYLVARGDAAGLREAATVVAPSDPAVARELEVVALIAERRYPDAVAAARAATEAFSGDVPLWQRRAAAEALAGDLVGATASIDRAMRLWPIDDRERGPFAQWVELRLYQGDEPGFAATVGGHWSPTNLLRLALWHDGEGLKADLPERIGGPTRRPLHSAMAPPPLFECVEILGPWRAGRDSSAYWSASPHVEVRAFGAGLAALDAGDLAGAEARFGEALDAATAETRPLFAWFVAHARRQRGDRAGASAACDEVIRPRGYVPYRAVLLRDCVADTGAAQEAPP